MKRIIRLTESDLTRIVRRVISEDVQSTPNVSIEELTFSVIDNTNRELYLSHKESQTYTSGVDIELSKNMFEHNEEVTVIIEGGFKCTSAKIETDEGYQPLTFGRSPSETGTIESDITFLPSMVAKENILGNVVIVLTGNVDDGELRLNLNFANSTVEPTNESYRRRYRRY